MAKFFNIILILIILVAGGRLIIRQQAHRALSQERNQLVEKLNGFQVRDRTKYLVQMVETSDPTLFTWRIHVPDGFQTEFLVKVGTEKGTPLRIFGFGRRGSLERASVGFEWVGDCLRIETQSGNGGGGFGWRGAGLVAFSQQHWNDFEVEILGEGEPVEVDANQIVDLLIIRISDELHSKLEAEFGEKVAKEFSNQCFLRISLGEEALVESNRQQSQGVPR